MLQTHPAGQLPIEVYEDLLTDLRIAGDVDNVTRCATNLLMAGPEDAVQRSCVPLKLLQSTHTTARADLERVDAAAEVLEEEELLSALQQAQTRMPSNGGARANHPQLLSQRT
jgi:hypothetical protein